MIHATAGNLEFMFPTGSRIICPKHCRHDSDWDFFGYGLGFHPWSAIEKFEHLGWREDDRFTTNREKYGNDGDFTLFGYEDLNMHLIVFFAYAKFEKFLAATEFCRSIEGPTDRDGRVKVLKKFLGQASKFDENIPF